MLRSMSKGRKLGRYTQTNALWLSHVFLRDVGSPKRLGIRDASSVIRLHSTVVRAENGCGRSKSEMGTIQLRKKPPKSRPVLRKDAVLILIVA